MKRSGFGGKRLGHALHPAMMKTVRGSLVGTRPLFLLLRHQLFLNVMLLQVECLKQQPRSLQRAKRLPGSTGRRV